MKFTMDQMQTNASPEKSRRDRVVRAPEPEPYEDETVLEEEPADTYGPEPEAPKPMPKWKMGLLAAVLLVGFLLVFMNLKGMINRSRMDGTNPPAQTETVPVTEASEVPTTGEVTKENEQESGAKAPASDIESLSAAVIQAQNEKELVEQELRNAKELLEASTAREAELRSELAAYRPEEGL